MSRYGRGDGRKYRASKRQLSSSKFLGRLKVPPSKEAKHELVRTHKRQQRRPAADLPRVSTRPHGVEWRAFL